jgi:hypothetical protein
MNLSAIDYVLWVANFLGEAVLFSILIYRCRWKEFPVFTALIGYEAAILAALYLTYLCCSQVWYARLYWTYALFDFFLQLGVIWEIARIVMRPTGTWVRDAKKQFILWGASGRKPASSLGGARKSVHQSGDL